MAWKSLVLGLALLAQAGADPGPLLSPSMPGRSFRGPLPALTPSQARLASRLRADVTTLAQRIGPRNTACHPDGLPGVGWSDHWALWQIGVPAVMVTDTAPFRYPHYHQPTDTPDKLDYERLARVVEGLVKVVAELARGRTTNP